MRSLLMLCFFVLTGCQNSFSTFYHPYYTSPNLPPGLTAADLKYLSMDEVPQIYSTDDISRDMKIARSQNWIPIGYSSFNGAIETQDKLLTQAKTIGSPMVLVASKFTGDRVTTIPLFLPNNTTTYYNGMTNGQIYGNNGNSANYNSINTGTATTYGIMVIPMTSVQSRYDQTAVYFVRNIRKFKYGTILLPLTPELRAKYERNTGALVEIVPEGSPAFKANLLPDDIIIEIDGKTVDDVRQAVALQVESNPVNGISTLKVLRNGVEKMIDVKIGP